MTLAPSTLARSAVEIQDDDGRAVATIYARAAGVEIVCAQHYSAAFSYDRRAQLDHLAINITRDEATSEARR